MNIFRCTILTMVAACPPLAQPASSYRYTDNESFGGFTFTKFDGTRITV